MVLPDEYYFHVHIKGQHMHLISKLDAEPIVLLIRACWLSLFRSTEHHEIYF